MRIRRSLSCIGENQPLAVRGRLAATLLAAFGLVACAPGSDGVGTEVGHSNEASGLEEDGAEDGEDGEDGAAGTGGGGNGGSGAGGGDAGCNTVVVVDEQGTRPSLALDAQGRVHISYSAFGYDDLRYATGTGDEGFDTTVVDTSSDAFVQSGIAVDADLGVHIVYYAGSGEFHSEYRYATKPAGGTWSRTTLNDNGYTSQAARLAIDGAGTLHAVVDGRGYWTKSAAGPWSESGLAVGLGDTDYVALAVDPSDGVHVSFQTDTATDGLHYNHKAAGVAWEAPQSVEDTWQSGEYSSLAVDSQGGIYIAYRWFSSPYGDLKVAYKPAGGTWTTETVDGTGTVHGETSLAIDPEDGVHVAYWDYTNKRLMLAHHPVGGGWTSEVLDDTDSNGTPSMAIGPDGTMHIAYDDLGEMKYLRRCAD